MPQKQKKISDMLQEKMTFSFEVFPPKDGDSTQPLLETLDELYRYEPDFVSCTCGAGGTSVGRQEEIVKSIIDSGHTAMAHFTCIGRSEADVDAAMTRFENMGVKNIFVLRGDFPAGWNSTKGAFAHADRLMHYIHKTHPALELGGACYIESHLESLSMEADIAHLRSKQINGAAFLTTQLCYDVEAFDRFCDKLDRAGVDIPVIVGVMPALYKHGVIRMTLENGCSIPARLARLIGKYGDKPEEFKKAGKEYTVELIYDYMTRGIAGLHLYSLNKYKDLADIIDASGVRAKI